MSVAAAKKMPSRVELARLSAASSWLTFWAALASLMKVVMASWFSVPARATIAQMSSYGPAAAGLDVTTRATTTVITYMAAKRAVPRITSLYRQMEPLS